MSTTRRSTRTVALTNQSDDKINKSTSSNQKPPAFKAIKSSKVSVAVDDTIDESCENKDDICIACEEGGTLFCMYISIYY